MVQQRGNELRIFSSSVTLVSTILDTASGFRSWQLPVRERDIHNSLSHTERPVANLNNALNAKLHSKVDLYWELAQPPKTTLKIPVEILRARTTEAKLILKMSGPLLAFTHSLKFVNVTILDEFLHKDMHQEWSGLLSWSTKHKNKNPLDKTHDVNFPEIFLEFSLDYVYTDAFSYVVGEIFATECPPSH